MYVNPEDDKVKQLHPDIGRTLPKEKLKLGKKMKSGSKVKKYNYRRGGLTTLRKPRRG